MNLVVLLVAWVAVFVLRVIVGGNATAFDEAALWLLRALAILIAIQVVVSVVRFIRDLVEAARQGEQVFTERSVKTSLIGVLTAGLICRVLTWGSGQQGLPGWAGVILIGTAVAGFGALYLRQANRERKTVWSYWSPYIRVVLVFLCIALLIALGAAQPTGTLGGALVAIFWLSLIALFIQIVGGRLRRPNQHLGK